MKVSYVGYSPVEMKITIPAGKTLEKDVVLNEGLELQEVVVGGAFQGQRRAINSQKNNLGITNVVSADQVGKFPDSNIGDASNVSTVLMYNTTRGSSLRTSPRYLRRPQFRDHQRQPPPLCRRRYP